MGGIFGVASKSSCTLDLFFGTDYHSHLGTRRGGLAVYGPNGFNRSIHNIENTPFRTKFDGDLNELEGNLGIGCISDERAAAAFSTVTSGQLRHHYRGERSTIWRNLWISLTKNGCTQFSGNERMEGNQARNRDGLRP